MKLDEWFVAGWRHSWTWFSVQMHVIGTAMLGIALIAPALPDEVMAIVPLKWRALMLGVWALVGLLARLKKQGSTQP